MSLQTPAASRDTTPEPSHKAPAPELTNEQLLAIIQKRGITLPTAAGAGDETGNGPAPRNKLERIRQENAQAVRKEQDEQDEQDERRKASGTISQDDTKDHAQSGKASVNPTVESDSGSIKPTDQSGKSSVNPTVESDSGSVQSGNGSRKGKAANNSKTTIENLVTAAEFAFVQKYAHEYFPEINSLCREEGIHVVTELGSIFRQKDPKRSILEFLFYANYTLSLHQDDSTEDPFGIIKKFAENPLPWKEIEWGSEFDTDLMDKRLESAREYLNQFETGTDSSKDQLSESETLFLKDQQKYFPSLQALPQEQLDIFMTQRIPEFRRRHPDRDILEFLFFTEFSLRTMKEPAKTIDEFSANPPEWNTIQWNGVFDQTTLSEAFKLMQLYRAGQRPIQTHQSPQDSNMSYNSEERRRMRAKFHGQGASDANLLTFPDPETGTVVTGEILGRHPQRTKWLAVALPGRGGYSRGYYVDCSNAEHRLALEAYVTRGANKVLSFATHKDQLDGCVPADFELNLVLVMPWGKSFRYNAYGIPHYQLDRDFMIFSKSILASSSDWGSQTMGVLHDHMLKAGQTIPQARSETPKPQGVKSRAWMH
ncbi:hypothetical protein CEP54_014864 [Fusarium duplospermum]|uniref:Uncharacterized protein n=1 Tax=Fusarium duplospermum TaxID=1325734 RepID=A0A428NT79_9HYPO|nr:hypothetical protein CEP54_014864 [Fusarium duplospermum]